MEKIQKNNCRILPEQLRSQRWFNQNDFRSFNHRSRMLQLGWAQEEFLNRPVIGILNTWSGLNACHMHFKDRVEDVKRGVLMAGGMPVELPCMSLYETLVKPSALLHRNLLAMEVEEMIRSNPIDGVVLMGGCDKTTPGLVLGAISAGVPAIFIPAGPMVKGVYRNQFLGSGSDAFKYWDDYRAGVCDEETLEGVCGGIARSTGTCMVMGTASAMTCIMDAMGISIPGAASIPAVDSSHIRMCSAAGRRIVDLVWEDVKLTDLITKESCENGIAVAMAEGCSTNAIIHVIAIARRAGIPVTIDDFDRISRMVPVLANIRPSGEKYLMEDFYYAGGVRALMNRMKQYLHLDCMTCTGRTIGEEIEGAQVYDDDVIRPLDNPVYPQGALAVLHGNLAPNGAVIKASACSPFLQKHTGPALVFDDYPSYKKVADSEALEVTPDSVIILRGCGPKGGPGMPEWGMVPIPGKLVRQGVRDMVRISDARMSGTSYGACVLHVSPEAHVGGPLALVENGDLITLDIPNRELTLHVSDEELARRRKQWQAPGPKNERGYGWIYDRHVTQAEDGCDFDFLQTDFGAACKEPDIF